MGEKKASSLDMLRWCALAFLVRTAIWGDIFLFGFLFFPTSRKYLRNIVLDMNGDAQLRH